MPTPPRPDAGYLNAGVFLTAMSLLLLELALTRLFSVVFYYHFAFLAISIALFGLGVGGILSYFVARQNASPFFRLGVLSLLNAILVLFALWIVLRPAADDAAGSGRMALLYLAVSLPFISGGIILSVAISDSVGAFHRVYFFALMGAAAGCLLLVPMLNLLGAPNTVIAVAAAFCVGGFVWFRLAGVSSVPAGAATLALLCFLGWNSRHRVLDVTFAKGSALTDEIYVKWNSFSRVGVRLEKGWGGPAIFIDADASTGIASEDFSTFPEERRRSWVRSQASSLPYVLRPSGRTLIIGPGGGWDVAHALAAGVRDLTGVEISPIIANDIMRGRFAAVSHYLYSRPEVRIVVEDSSVEGPTNTR